MAEARFEGRKLYVVAQGCVSGDLSNGRGTLYQKEILLPISSQEIEPTPCHCVSSFRDPRTRPIDQASNPPQYS